MEDQSSYFEERRALIQAEFEQSRLFDRSILTLSSAAFGITLTFINKIVPEVDPCTMVYIYVGLGALVLSVTLTLVSFITSQRAYRRQVDILDEEVHNGKNCFACTTACLNLLSGVSFILGLVSLAVFVLLNIKPDGG